MEERLYGRWNEGKEKYMKMKKGKEDFIEDRMKGGKIIWNME